jgi:hypothetical protein
LPMVILPRKTIDASHVIRRNALNTGDLLLFHNLRVFHVS